MPAKNILRVFLVTLGLLLIPLILQVTIGTGVDGQGFNWKTDDFVVMGTLIFLIGLTIDIAWRRLGKHRALGILAIVVLFLWTWAELAVGLFTNWGS